MLPSEMLRHVALVRTDVSEELSATIIRVTRIGELGTTLAVTSNRRTWHNIPEDGILHSRRRGNLKSYKCVAVCKAVWCMIFDICICVFAAVT
jgi:hypothetical protein